MLHLNIDLTEIAVCVRGAFVRARHGACECVLHCMCIIYGNNQDGNSPFTDKL